MSENYKLTIMKELSTEEKAKAYDEAIEKARIWKNKSGMPKDRQGILDDIFPEIKESVDERIELLNYLYDVHDDDEERARWIAWLEKQGEQKLVQETEPTPIFKIGDILKRKGKDYTFRVDRIQGGYYHCDRNHGAFFPIEEQGNWELVAQKPTWSEEDDIMVHDIDYALRCQIAYPKPRLNSMSLWIYELKNRVQPKPKWKPSDAQMRALKEVCDEHWELDGLDPLYTLYQDLKKLK